MFERAADNLIDVARPRASMRAKDSSHRFRLYFLSWIVLVGMTACMVVIIVPGTLGHSMEYERQPLLNFHTGEHTWSDYSYREVSTWTHGWPFEYVRRSFSLLDPLVTIQDLPVSWSSPSAWNFSGRIYEFSALTLVVDVLVGVITVVIAVVGCEVWRRKRAGLRFSLLDTIAFASVVCAILGWWQYHSRNGATEQAIKTDMIARGSLPDFSKRGPIRARVESNYHGPDWLKRLVGHPEFFPFCSHIDRLNLDSRLLTGDDFTDIRKLKYVCSVHCVGTLTAELVESLAQLPNLNKLDGEIVAFGGNGIPYPDPMLTSTNIGLLIRLPRLTTLNLGHSKIQPRDLRQLALMPRLELAQLRGREFLVEDLDVLTSCRNLKTIVASITATEKERLAFEAAHPNLRVFWEEASVLYGRQPVIPSEAWEVMSVLFERWQAEDGVSEPQTLDHEQLDFTDIKLTRDRLRRMPIPRFPKKVQELSFGRVDSLDSARELIHRCGQLKALDARYILLTNRDIELLSCENDAWLYLQQGPLTVQDFCKMNRRLKPEGLCIYASRFTLDEVAEIQDASPDTILDVYRGYDDDEAEEVAPAFDSEDSPF